MQEAARAYSGLLTSTKCQSIDLDSVPALARVLLDTQSRSQPASIHFLAHAWPISGRMGSKIQVSKGEMVADLAVGHLKHAVPYTAGNYDLCSAADSVLIFILEPS